MRTIPPKPYGNEHDANLGLYRRYEVKRSDGETEPNALYFVLRLDADGSDQEHIQACQAAALEFARHTRNRKLADDIVRLVAEQAGLMAARGIMRELTLKTTEEK